MGISYKVSGLRLRQERERRDLTIAEFAEMAGISVTFLGQIERGERLPSMETFERFLEVLGIPPNDLMDAKHRTNGTSTEQKISALLRGQTEERKLLALETLRFVFRRLAKA